MTSILIKDGKLGLPNKSHNIQSSVSRLPLGGQNFDLQFVLALKKKEKTNKQKIISFIDIF